MTVIPISHPGRGPSPEDSHQRDQGGIKPPTIRPLWIVDLHCCHDFRRFNTEAEASEFQAEHWRRYHGRQA